MSNIYVISDNKSIKGIYSNYRDAEILANAFINCGYTSICYITNIKLNSCNIIETIKFINNNINIPNNNTCINNIDNIELNNTSKLVNTNQIFNDKVNINEISNNKVNNSEEIITGLMNKKKELVHTLNCIKFNKKKIKDIENEFKSDLELYNKFKTLNLDSEFKIPELFKEKFEIIKLLENSNNLNYYNYVKKLHNYILNTDIIPESDSGLSKTSNQVLEVFDI